MRIETATTPDRRNRILILLVMCIGFSMWFAYDGLSAYPAKNLKWARQFLPTTGKQADLAINPRVTVARLEKLRPAIAADPGTTADAMTIQALETELGPPTLRDETSLYYIGPAAFASFQTSGDRVVGVGRIEAQREPSESDIRNQKALAMLLAAVAVGVFVHLLRVTRERVVLDDDGLKIRGRTIAWDDMKSLDQSRLQEKGWVTLLYRGEGGESSVRLDGYTLDRFDEMVAAIREKKGFHATTADQQVPPDPSA